MASDGLTAWILTFHQPTATAALVIAALSLLPYWVAFRHRPASVLVLGGLAFFLGVSVACHVSLSWLVGVRAVSVEVISLDADQGP